MTSGVFETVPIAALWVDRDARQRKELRNIEDLAESIRERGLIHPPVVTRDFKLIAGERRWTACKELGWTSIPVQFIESEDPTELEIVELHENLKRENIDWKEQVMAIRRLHEAQLARDPSWTTEKTAKDIGFEDTKVYDALDISKRLEAGDAMVHEAPHLSAARNITIRKNKREREDAELELEVALAPPEIRKEVEAAVRTAPLENVSFHDWQRNYRSTKFNFIHCDFPYGIDADKHDQSGGHLFGGYADGFEVYTELLDTLEAAMDNVVAKSAHLMFWFSMDYYQFTKERLEKMGWKVNPFPLIWYKEDGRGVLPDYQRGPRRNYETAFFCSRGDRLIVKAVGNVAASPNKKEIHMSEKPRAMLAQFFRMIVSDTTVMLDPTCGSGNAVRVAVDQGAAKALGLEVDKTFYDQACQLYFEA